MENPRDMPSCEVFEMNIDEEWEVAEDVPKQVELRKQYWRLGRTSFADKRPHMPRPITCFLHPKVTPLKLRDHLIHRGVSETRIVLWMRRLQEVREGPETLADVIPDVIQDDVTPDQEPLAVDLTYGVEMMGN